MFAHAAQSRSFTSLSGPLKSNNSFFSTETDGGYTRLNQSTDSVLERARIHGIESSNRLDFEADLGNVRTTGTRLLDDDNIRQDLDLWAIVLDYRQLKDGPGGVRDVLSAMLHGGVPVKLQSDSVSGHIWRTILPVVLAEEKLLYELCQVRLTVLKERPMVFLDVVGQLLATGNTRLAIIYGTQHLMSHFRGHADLIDLFDVVLLHTTEDVLLGFCQIISRLPRYNIYAEIVPRLWKAGRKHHTFLLHKHLLSLGDHPTDFSQIEFLVQELAMKNVKIEPFVRELEKHGVSFSHQIRRFHTQERLRYANPSNMAHSHNFDPSPGARPVKLSDAFVARTFATRSVSFDFVLNGLIFIGLFEIGPLAVRELALAAESIQELKRRFTQLEKLEVDLGASNYVRVVKNLCMSERQDLLQAILASDMHHDELEDTQKQKRLLGEYYRKFQWPEVNRTLAILNGGSTGMDADFRSARYILQTALIQGSWREALIALDSVRQRAQGVLHVSELAPLRLALRRIWTKIEAKTRTSTNYLDRHRYLVGFIQISQIAGLRVYPWQWRSVLHTVGRSADWNTFRRLMLSVPRLLSSADQAAVSSRYGGQSQRSIALDEVFDGDMQSFVMEVSLTAAIEDKTCQEVWLRGVGLLYSLSNKFPINMDYHVVSKAFKNRLQSLFAGADVGAQRRLVNLYLGNFNWAWAEVVSSSDQRLPHSLYQRGVTEPDSASLKLFRLRSRLVWLRKKPVIAHNNESRDQIDMMTDETGLVAAKEIVPSKESHTFRHQAKDENADTFNNVDNSAVFYEDLLHPSYVKSNGVQQ